MASLLRNGTSRYNSCPGILYWNHVSCPHRCLPIASHTLLFLRLLISHWADGLSSTLSSLQGQSICPGSIPISMSSQSLMGSTGHWTERVVSLQPWHTVPFSSFSYSPSFSFILGPAAGPMHMVFSLHGRNPLLVSQLFKFSCLSSMISSDS